MSFWSLNLFFHSCLLLSLHIYIISTIEPHTNLPPSITDSRPIVRARESERVFLPCVGQAFPEPTYRWGRRDGDRVTSFHLGDRILQKDGVLIIQQAAIQDTGVYVCELNNSAGQDKAETKLLVSGRWDDCVLCCWNIEFVVYYCFDNLC